MIKIKITSERFSEACGIYQYLAILNGDSETAIRLLPRFVTDDEGKYIMGVVLDEEGDIKEFTNITEAVNALSNVTPKRLEGLTKQITEAARNIVNPQNEGA